MVDMMLLQQVSYIAGALGVCVAAFYYVSTLRVQQTNMKEAIKNRRATFVSNESQFLCSKEWIKSYMDVWNMQWTDYEDFKRKYRANSNFDLFAEKWVVWYRFDLIGRQYRCARA